MPKATKIVIEFDDGTRYDVDPTKAGSIFTSEAAAKKCGHNPPYDKPPKQPSGGTDSADSSTTSVDANVDATASVTTRTGATGTTCYFLNGIIVCP